MLHGIRIAFLLVVAGALAAPTAVRASVREWRRAHEAAILTELAGFLSLPNRGADSLAIRANADRLVSMLQRRGVQARLLEAPGSPPAVFGEMPAPGARRTVVLYAHYDGQPADSTAWSSPPWKPVLRDGERIVPWADVESGRERPDGEWRLYARSASDDKGPIVAMLAALDALRAAGRAPSVNLKFFFEGEEEAGSPHLGDMLRRHRDLLLADGWIFCDGPVHQSRKQQVVFGARGVMGLEMTTYGPLRALHSGHYGNWAPNPIGQLVHLVASMRDADGCVQVEGFDADIEPPDAAMRRAAQESPDVEAELQAQLGIARPEGGSQRLAERVLLPALNLRGMQAGGVGEGAANAIPTEARASIDFRLVPGQTPAGVRQRVEAHLERQGCRIVHQAPDLETRRRHPQLVRLDWEAGYPAVRTSMELPFSRAVLQVADAASGSPVVRLPTLGGSLPLYVFVEELGATVVIVPMVNHDNNQHAADENLRLQNLWDGIELYAALMADLGAAWR